MSLLHHEASVSHPELIAIPDLRVSCASFTDIRIGNSILLTLNKNQLRKGIRTLTPVGGAIEVTSGGMTELMHLLGIEQAAFEKGYDLRFTMHGQNADRLREWFLKRKNRETDPMRELREELVDEIGVLNAFDLHDSRYKLNGYQTEVETSNRIGQEGKLTLRLMEVYQTQLNPTSMHKLDVAAKLPDSLVRFVTAADIQNRVSTEGISIGSVASTLLAPQRSIAKFF